MKKDKIIIWAVLLLTLILLFFLKVPLPSISLFFLGFVWVYALSSKELKEKSTSRRYKYSSIRFYFLISEKMYQIIVLKNERLRLFVSRIISCLLLFILLSLIFQIVIPIYWIVLGGILKELLDYYLPGCK